MISVDGGVRDGASAPDTAGPAFHAYGDGDSGLGAPCLTDSMEVYFGANVTLSALGIPAENNFIVLDNGIGMNYTIDAPFVGPVYERAIKVRVQLSRLGEGDFFGEMSLLTDTPATADIVSVSYSSLMVLKTSDFLAFVSRFPELASTERSENCMPHAPSYGPEHAAAETATRPAGPGSMCVRMPCIGTKP